MDSEIKPTQVKLKKKYRQEGQAGFKGQWAAPGWHQK